MADALKGGIAFFGDHRGVVTIAEVDATLDLRGATSDPKPDQSS
jgi:hypothetical protein